MASVDLDYNDTYNIAPVFGGNAAETLQVLNLYSNGKRLTDGAAVLGCFQAGLTLFLNITCFLFIVSREKLRRQLSKKLFLNLQGINNVLSIIVIASVFYLPGKTERIVTNSLLLTKFIALIVTTADRYLCIAQPYRYRKLTAHSSAIIVIITLSWFPAVVFSVTGIAVGNISDPNLCIVQIAVFLAAALVLVSSNVKIYTIARAHSKREKNNEGRKVLKATYVCVSIVLCFVLLWFPFFIHNILALLKFYIPRNDHPFTLASLQIGLLHSLFEPVLYLAFQKDAKGELRKSLNHSNNSRERSQHRDEHSL